MSDNRNRAIAALIFTVLIWGVTPVYVRAFTIAVGPLDSLVIRTIGVTIFFGITLALTSGFAIERKDWPRLGLVSVIGMLGYFTFSNFGFVHAPAGIGTLIMATQPMLIAVLAWLVGQEKLSNLTVAGLLVSFAGSALLVWGEDMATSTSSAQQVIVGCGLIFIAGIAWALFVVFARPLIQKYGAIKITGLSNMIVLLPLLPFINGETLQVVLNLKPDAQFSLAFLTFFGATVSVVTWNYAAGIVKPSMLGAALYVVPVLAVIAGWALLDEAITLNIIVAACIILAGVVLSSIRTAKSET